MMKIPKFALSLYFLAMYVFSYFMFDTDEFFHFQLAGKTFFCCGLIQLMRE
jgi:hypothetical protein